MLSLQHLGSESAASAAEQLAVHALGWASANGLSIGVKEQSGLFTTTHLPFTLMPNALPRGEYERAKRWAPLFNTLVDAIARDPQWLQDVHKDVISGDPFTAELLKILAEAQNSPQQQLALGIQRSDYMLHAPEGAAPQLMQVPYLASRVVVMADAV